MSLRDLFARFDENGLDEPTEPEQPEEEAVADNYKTVTWRGHTFYVDPATNRSFANLEELERFQGASHRVAPGIAGSLLGADGRPLVESDEGLSGPHEGAESPERQSHDDF